MYTGEITDPHQHLWNYNNKYSHGWLQMKSHPWTGDWTMLAKSYLIEDYFEDIKNQNVTKSVHVEAEWADEPGSWGETIWLQEISNKYEELIQEHEKIKQELTNYKKKKKRRTI